jgi:type I restriction enzyme S subunit
VRSSYGRLNETEGNDFRAAASFAIKTLGSLTARSNQIKHLRQTILNLAVRGKLVPQDPTDEPAEELLNRIQKDNSQLSLKSKARKTNKATSTPTNEFSCFALPGSWRWARFAEIASVQSNLVDPQHYGQYPHIAPDNIESRTGRLLPYETIGDSQVFSVKHLFKPGCLLYSKIRPALAKVTSIDFEGLCSADMYPICPFIYREYLKTFMLADIFISQSVSEDNRLAMPKINQESLSKILVAIPPLAEQHRIVAKVNELNALCDELESSLTTTDTTRKQLLESLLSETITIEY